MTSKFLSLSELPSPLGSIRGLLFFHDLRHRVVSVRISVQQVKLITLLQTLKSFPTSAWKSPKRIMYFYFQPDAGIGKFLPRIAGTVRFSLGRIPVLNTGIGPTTSTSTCTIFLPVGSLHQHCVPAEGLQTYAFQPGQTLLAQRGRRRVSTNRSAQKVLEPSRLVKEMPTTFKKYRLASSTGSCSFPVSETIFQFPIDSLWHDCRLHVTFRFPRVQALCLRYPIHLPRCVVDAIWWIKLRITTNHRSRKMPMDLLDVNRKRDRKIVCLYH